MRCNTFSILLTSVALVGCAVVPDEKRVTPQETLRLVEDEGFFAFPKQRNGEPMPLEQLQEQGSGNIVLVDFTDPAQLVIQVQGQFQRLDQLGVNLDIDHDGQGDYWIFIDPVQSRSAFLTDAYLVPLGRVPFVREGESTVVLPIDEIAGEYRLADHFGDFDPALIVATFNREITSLEMLPMWFGEERIEYQLGEPVEIVQVNAPQGDSPAYGFLIEGQQSQRQQQTLKDKYCRPKKPLPGWYVDRDSDGKKDDYYFFRNTQVHGSGEFAIRIQLYCMSNSAFGKWIQDSTGRRGWIARCPYSGGRNRQDKIDLDDDGVPDLIRRTILDGAPDTNGDLAFTEYEYDVRTGMHTTTKSVYEDWVNVGTNNPIADAPIPNTGPYPTSAALP